MQSELDFDGPVLGRDPDTSAAAADKMEAKAPNIRVQVFLAIQDAGREGLTNTEIADILKMNPRSVQPRTSELSRRHEAIRDSGERRTNAYGNQEIVWKAKK